MRCGGLGSRAVGFTKLEKPTVDARPPLPPFTPWPRTSFHQSLLSGRLVRFP